MTKLFRIWILALFVLTGQSYVFAASPGQVCGMAIGVEMSLWAMLQRETYEAGSPFPTYYNDEIGPAGKMYMENRALVIAALGKSLNIRAQEPGLGKSAKALVSLARSLTNFRTSVDSWTIRRSSNQAGFLHNQDAAIRSLAEQALVVAQMICE